jgi:hypothetical protein
VHRVVGMGSSRYRQAIQAPLQQVQVYTVHPQGWHLQLPLGSRGSKCKARRRKAKARQRQQGAAPG